MMLRLLAGALALLLLSAHSPWGQYQVYRQKYLLVMSNRQDPPTYVSSKRLIDAVNSIIPEARMRPARARDFQRVHALLASGQMQLTLISEARFGELVAGTGAFAGLDPVEAQIVYKFEGLLLVARTAFPARFTWEIATALKTGGWSAEPLQPYLAAEGNPTAAVHPGARLALTGHPKPSQIED